jgi:cellulose synthase/poly-beta-1,6-N-acetylglucosamine synthase-like glycosyltransferase
MYTLRPGNYPFPPVDTILDDFVISMHLVCSGLRLIHDNEALGYERNISEMKQEYRRKVRIVAGGLQSLLRGQISPPKKQVLTWFKLISHKLLRWFSGPIFALLIALLIADFVLTTEHSLLVILISSGITLAFLMELLSRVSFSLCSNKIFVLSHYLLVMHAASLVGCWRGLWGQQSVTWKQVQD